MKIIVLAKQVPDVNQIKFDPATGRIIRDNVPLNMNSFDRRAVEEGIRIKEKMGAEVEVISMGPPQARAILEEAIRMGADRAFLISDRKFGGSDTWATSFILSKFISSRKPDLILAGRYSLDGETSQVPPETAKMLNMRFFSAISKIDFVQDHVEMEQDFEDGIRHISSRLPMVISVSEKINRARKADENMQNVEERIFTIDSKLMNLDFDGSKGSLTVVEGTQEVRRERKGEKVDMEKALEILYSHLKNRNSGIKAEITEINSDGSKGTLMGIAFLDPEVSMEISAKLNDMGRENGFNVIMAGNIPPEKLKGMAANKYYYLDGSDIFSLEQKIVELMDRIKPEFILFPSNSTGRDVAGMIAAEKSLGLTADCVDVSYENKRLIQFKPAFGGGIVARISSRTKPEMATVRPGMFAKKISNSSLDVETIRIEDSGEYKVLKTDLVESKFMPVNKAAVVLGIGRGVKNRADIEKVVKFCEENHIAAGASRPVVDMRMMPRQTQIGITGTSISPDLYVAIGVAGMDYHMAGLRYAKTILAINNNPEAPINHLADYVCNGDAVEFINRISTHHQ